MDVDNSPDARERAGVAGVRAQRQGAASLARAEQWHNSGRFDAAGPEYQAVLEREPQNVRALHLYGVLQYQRGDVADAVTLLRRSIALEPGAAALSDLGAILVQDGRINEGLEQFESALRIEPDHIPTLVRLGNTRIALRQPQNALEAFDRVLKVSPLVLDALCNRGGALRLLGRHDEALDTYDRALLVDPRSFESWFNRALVLREMKRFAEALHCLDQAIAIQPGVAAMHSLHGQTLVDLGRLREALAAFNEAIAIEPGMVEAIYNSAVALERLNRADEALNRCERVLALVPDHAAAHACRGNALQQMTRYEEALASYELALRASPGAVDVLCNRGTVLRFLKRYDEALDSYDAALDRDAQLAQAWTNRSSVLQDLHRYDEALVSLHHATRLRPEHATNWLNRGNLYYETNREVEALAAYERAIALNPDYADAHFARAALYLIQGDFARGWPEYEWRLRDSQLAQHYRPFPQPLWRGDAPLAGKTILIHAEQGLGDTLQFCRYMPQLARMDARVIFEVQPPLRELMASLDGPDRVLAKGEPLPAFDFQCPLLSLPFAFRTDLATIPAQTPYLRADPRRVRYWEDVSGEKRRPRIGIAWAGNPEHRNDHNRSIELASLSPLLALDVEWVSLQKQVPARDEKRLADVPLRRVEDELIDFADTAALIQTLDLVISVDTSVAHLAGALGRPVWVLLPDPPEWRWMRGRDDSPWYPAARLFRQTVPGQWAGVIEAVRTAIGRALG